jgi:ATP-dependent Zn protease
MKNLLLTVAAVLAMPAVALAQTADAPKPQSLLENLLFTLLPIIFIAVFIWLFFIRSIRKIQTRQIEDYRQHREKVEQLLERIAKAVEKRNGDAG